MDKKKAKVIFKHNSFDIINEGDFVVCAISGKKIPLEELNYWSVESQEAYFSPVEAKESYNKFKLKK